MGSLLEVDQKERFILPEMERASTAFKFAKKTAGRQKSIAFSMIPLKT
jgi:hypothetical protein